MHNLISQKLVKALKFHENECILSPFLKNYAIKLNLCSVLSNSSSIYKHLLSLVIIGFDCCEYH